ncbi:hypothetical protein Tco_0046128 [Tanacetum coccineum]
MRLQCPDHVAPYPIKVCELLREDTDDATLDPLFVIEVVEPLQIEQLMDIPFSRFVTLFNKTAFVVEHLANNVVVFEGTPSVDCVANAPQLWNKCLLHHSGCVLITFTDSGGLEFTKTKISQRGGDCPNEYAWLNHDPDKDEVYEAGDVMSRYMSSLGGGQQLEDDELDFSDVYEAQVYDLPG